MSLISFAGTAAAFSVEERPEMQYAVDQARRAAELRGHMPASFLALVNEEEHSPPKPDGLQLGETAGTSPLTPCSSLCSPQQCPDVARHDSAHCFSSLSHTHNCCYETDQQWVFATHLVL